MVQKSETFSKDAEGGGNTWRVCGIVRIFLVFYISGKIDQIGVLHLENFLKNGVKRSKNPILHDSPDLCGAVKESPHK